MNIDLLVADDHPTVIAGILHEVERVPSIKVVGTAGNSTEIVRALNSSHCDVLVTDYAMPGGTFGDGLSLLTFLARRFPNLKTVVFTMMDNQAMVQQMRNAGIHAIVSKRDPARHLVTAINEVYVGAEFYSPSISSVEEALAAGLTPQLGSDFESTLSRLSPKELECLRLYALGLTVSQIAEQLHRSKQTISGQKVSAKRKLGITRDADLFRFAFDAGLVMGREDRHQSAAPHGGEEQGASPNGEPE